MGAGIHGKTETTVSDQGGGERLPSRGIAALGVGGSGEEAECGHSLGTGEMVCQPVWGHRRVGAGGKVGPHTINGG